MVPRAGACFHPRCQQACLREGTGARRERILGRHAAVSRRHSRAPFPRGSPLELTGGSRRRAKERIRPSSGIRREGSPLSPWAGGRAGGDGERSADFPYFGSTRQARSSEGLGSRSEGPWAGDVPALREVASPLVGHPSLGAGKIDWPGEGRVRDEWGGVGSPEEPHQGRLLPPWEGRGQLLPRVPAKDRAERAGRTRSGERVRVAAGAGPAFKGTSPPVTPVASTCQGVNPLGAQWGGLPRERGRSETPAIALSGRPASAQRLGWGSFGEG